MLTYNHEKYVKQMVDSILSQEVSFKYELIYDRLAENGIHARKYFYPLTSDQACFKNMYRDVQIQVARELSARILVLPIYEGIDSEEVEAISLIIGE